VILQNEPEPDVQHLQVAAARGNQQLMERYEPKKAPPEQTDTLRRDGGNRDFSTVRNDL